MGDRVPLRPAQESRARCMTCPAFQPLARGWGECRFVAPGTDPRWPRVRPTDWCLDHPGNARAKD